MRGLRLFVRPLEPSDRDELLAFFDKEQHPAAIPACGLLGKLLGEVVATLAFEVTADAIRIDDLLVTRDLRRKWIGRVMLRELEQLALKLERPILVVEDDRGAAEFFRRVGFVSEGRRWVRTLR